MLYIFKWVSISVGSWHFQNSICTQLLWTAHSTVWLLSFSMAVRKDDKLIFLIAACMSMSHCKLKFLLEEFVWHVNYYGNMSEFGHGFDVKLSESFLECVWSIGPDELELARRIIIIYNIIIMNHDKS